MNSLEEIDSAVQDFWVRYGRAEWPHYRLGQAFYNHFRPYLPHPFPKLFYAEKETAMEIIEVVVGDWKEKIKNHLTI
jgi:hypothetical protein